MSYNLIPVRGKLGQIVISEYYSIPITPGTVAGLIISVSVFSVSAGVLVGNPATIEIEQSWDSEATWVTITDTVVKKDNNSLIDTIYAAGNYLIYPTPASGRLSPLVRLKISVPAGEEIIVSNIQHTTLDSGDASSIVSIPDLSITANASTSFKIGPDGALVDSTINYVTDDFSKNAPLPVALLQGQGGSPISAPVIAEATKVTTLPASTNPSILTSSVMMGWDTSTNKHAELSIDPFGNMNVTSDIKITYGPSGSQFSNPVDYCTDDRTQNVAVPTIALIAQGDYPVSGLAITNASVESNDIKATAIYGVAMGWNGTTHKELGLGAQGAVKTVPVFENDTQSNLQDFTSNSLTDTPETILTLTASVHAIDINDTSGYHINLYVDGVLAFVIPPGGLTYEVSPTVFDSGSVITIAAQTGVTITTGAIVVTTFSAWASF